MASILLQDACVLINLLASGRFEDIASECGFQFATVPKRRLSFLPGLCNIQKGNGVCRLVCAREPPEKRSVLITPTSAKLLAGFVMLNALLIFVGGGLGSLARWGASGFIARYWGETFPWGTLFANVSGSFVIGLFATLTGPDGRWLSPSSFRQFFMIGICGGYTTFSSFSLQTLTLAKDAEWFKAGANAVLSMVLCLLAVWLGHALALYLNSTKGP